MLKPRRVLGYARVSSEEQAKGSSLQDQQDAIAAYAKARGVSVARFYVEAESGIRKRVEHREQMAALMADVRAGDLVVCDKLDRWSRDAEFSYSSIRQIHERGASFYSVSEQCDPATPEGDTALSFRILFAREEHKRIKQRMVGTRKLLRDRGLYVEGLPPFGYVRGAPPARNVLLVSEPEAELVRRAFKLCIQGQAVTAIAEELGLVRSRVSKILRTRSYLGESKDSQGRWAPGPHVAIVDVETFQRARDAIAGRRNHGALGRRGEGETSTWILRNVAVCARCGAGMSSAYAGPHDARRYYYRGSASCTTSYVRVEPAERAAAAMVLDRMAELREELASGPVAPKRPRVDHAGKLARLEAKRDRLRSLFVDGDVGRDEYRERTSRLDEEQTRLEAAVAQAGRPDALQDPAVRREVLADVLELEARWVRASAAQRQQLVGVFAVAFRLAAGAEPVPVWRSVADLVREVST